MPGHRYSRPTPARVGYGQDRMRRLVLLISALMVLDTVSFAAVIPLLPHYRARVGAEPVRCRGAAGFL